MTFKEAKTKKELLADTYLDSGLEYGYIIIPELENDKERYKKFVEHNFTDFDDDDAIEFSSNKKFSLGGLWSDGANVIVDLDLKI
jgi:hypothetical protein